MGQTPFGQTVGTKDLSLGKVDSFGVRDEPDRLTSLTSTSCKNFSP